jgi:hypothetical protein
MADSSGGNDTNCDQNKRQKLNNLISDKSIDKQKIINLIVIKDKSIDFKIINRQDSTYY